MTTLLIVATEASGDLHGSNLARALRKRDPGLQIIGVGGPRMKEAGVEILVDPTGHASVGLVEAFQNMHRYARLYRILQSVLRKRRPDAAILIDSPDFNLRFAERAVDHGVPVIYYIAPQVWAWRPGRLKTIRRLVRKMIVILDFEEKIYRDAGVDVAFVGHPLLDAAPQLDRAKARRALGAKGTLVGLLPGSRRGQFTRLFPILRKTSDLIAREIPDAHFIAACAPAIDPRTANGKGVEVVWDRASEVMAASDLLITASGTATLEAAIHGTPMIVTYRLNPVTALAVIPFVKIRNYALVNIVAGRRIMPELYQFKGKPENLAREAVSILKEGRLDPMRRDLAEVRRRLGPPGASDRAAGEVLAVLKR